jgi:hypothetical protein
MKRKLAFLLIMMLLGAGSAFAAPTFDLDFYSTTNPVYNYVKGVYDTGQTIRLETDEVVWIDFYVSGIPVGEGLGGYGFNVSWENTLLSWNGPATKDQVPVDPFQIAFGNGEIGSGFFQIQALSKPTTPPTYKDGDNILLATFSLKAENAIGVTDLKFKDWPDGGGNWILNDVNMTDFGNLLYGQTLGTIQVNAVPIPAALWLFGSGLLGLLGFRKRVLS